MESNVEILSDVQIIEEQSKTKSSNENTCEKPSELHSTFDKNLATTTKTTQEGEHIFMVDLENFPMSVIQIMLFKLQDSGKIAEQNLIKILLDTHSIKTNIATSWVSYGSTNSYQK